MEDRSTEDAAHGQDLGDLINIADFEVAARERLSTMAYGYYVSGADDEVTLRDNAAAYGRVRLLYRVLRDISQRSLATRVLGHEVSMPILVAPTAFHRLAHDEGEVATARAASSRGTIMMLSTLSTRSIEDVAAASQGPVFFQLYCYRDRGLTRDLVARAVEAGCKALVLTVDAQIFGVRERDVRNRFHLPPGIEAQNLLGTDGSKIPPLEAGSGLGAYVESLFDPSLSWRDVDWLASLSDLPLVVKGIVHPDDARLAADHGARGVIVSNHGGRQLDYSPATFDVLPRVVDAVGDRLEVLLDGGIRRGTDVLKALAYGAVAVAVGRPALWGLAAGGQSGVERVLDLLRDELDRAMALCGCASIRQVDGSLVERFPG